MKIRLTQTFLVIAISLFIPLVSTYHVYFDLADADFFSGDINLGNFDQENLLADQDNESKIFLSDVSSVRSAPILSFLEKFPLLSLKICSPDQMTFVLRC
jgi:hypothetical protein